MNRQDLLTAIAAADPTNDYEERAVFVLDEEGFQHVIDGIVWDPDDGCFWMRTSFKHRPKNGDGVVH